MSFVETHTNMYSMILESWYQFKYCNPAYMQFLEQACNQLGSISYTKEFCTLTFSLGRRSGSTTAIANFIKDHPELNIKFISNVSSTEIISRLRPLNGYNYKLSEVSFKGIIDNIDILFIDDYRFMSNNTKDLFHNIQYEFNRKRHNQFIIQVGA